MLIEGLSEAFTAEALAEGTQTDAGTSPNRVARYIIRNAYGEDVTNHFLHIQTVDGRLTVNPAPITIITGSAEKTFDGTPLTNGDAFVTGLISQDTGTERPNLAFAAADAAGSGCLWGLTGTVQVFGCNPLTGETAFAQVSAGQKLRVFLSDGSAQTILFTVEPIPADQLPEALLRLLSSDEALLARACEEAGWDQADLEARIAALSDGTAAEEERLIENCANVKIMIDSAVTDYSGVPLRLEEAEYIGIHHQEGIGVTATGSQTEAGSSPNTYTIEWGSAKPENYAISEKLGTLTVTECEHQWGAGAEIAPATCAAGGFQVMHCEICGERKTETLPPDPDHHIGGTEWINTAKATCIEPGYSGDAVCVSCGRVVQSGAELPRDPANHIGGRELRDSRIATCAEQGYTGDTICASCRAVLHSGSATPKNSSNHVGGTSVKNTKTATCADNGYSGDTVCNGCGAVLRSGAATPKNSSNHVGGTTVKNTKTATCADNGYSGDTVCNGCGAVLSSGSATPKNPSNHAGGTALQNAKAATCAETGYSGDTVCNGCGAVLNAGNTTPKDSSNHVGGTVTQNARAATCAETGYSGDTVCRSCGAVLSAGSETPKDSTNHTGGIYTAEYLAPTCVSLGYTGNEYCAGCGAYLNYGVDLPYDPDNHESLYTGGGVAPTCTMDGYTAETLCSACGTFISGGEIIPATGHSWVANTSPYIVTTYTCTVCGEVSTTPY